MRLFVINTGGLYFVLGGGHPWTSNIDRATRFEAEQAASIVQHITKGPEQKRPKDAAPEDTGPFFSPTWKWVRSPVTVGLVYGFRTIHEEKPVRLENGTVETKMTKRLERFEYESRPAFEIVEVTDGVPYNLIEHFMRVT